MYNSHCSFFYTSQDTELILNKIIKQIVNNKIQATGQ